MAKDKPQRKPPEKPAQSHRTPSAGGFPSIDTNFAVEAAAAMVNARKAKSREVPKKESLEFRQLKEGIDDPALSSIDNLLDQTSTTKKKPSSAPFEQNRGGQTAHNQTQGGNLTRSGVPRRTAG